MNVISKILAGVVTNGKYKFNFLTGVFSKEIVESVRVIELQKYVKSARVAKFVNPQMVAKGTETPDFSSLTFTLPTIQDIQVISGESLERVILGDTPYMPRTPEEKISYRVSQVSKEQRAMIAGRIEQSAVEAIFEGKITVVGDGENRIIDFGRDPKFDINLTGKRWNTTTSDITSDFITALSLGSGIDSVVGKKELIMNIIKDEKISKNLDNRRVEMGGLEFTNRLSTDGVVYFGHYMGIGIYGYDCNNTMPDKQVAFLNMYNNQNILMYGDYPQISQILPGLGDGQVLKDEKNYYQSLKVDGNILKLGAVQTASPLLADGDSVVVMQVIN